MSKKTERTDRHDDLVHADELPVALCRFDGERCVFANEAWSRLTGRPADTALEDGWLEAIHPEDRDGVLELREANRRGRPGERRTVDGVECRYLLPDGSVHSVLTRMRLEYGETGEATRRTVVAFDTTEHQRRMSRILETTTDYIGIAAPPGTVLWENKPLLDLRARLRPEGGPRQVGDLHPEWAMKLLLDEALPQATETGSWSGETALIDLEGNEIPISQVVLAHRGPDGEVESFSTVMRDISAQKAVEEALREGERTFSSLAAAAPVAIFRMSDPETCTYVNERWGQFTHQPLRAALGRGWAESVLPEDLASIGKILEAFAADPNAIFAEPYEVRHVLPDGTTPWVQVHLAKELDEHGNVAGYVGTLSDIDRLKRTEAELAKATRMKDRFLANMSHELRTPMTVVLGMVEALQGGVYGELSEKQRDGLRLIEQSGTQLLQLINDTLDLAKIEAGRIELELASIDVTQLCESSLHMISQHAGQRRIELELDVPEDLPNIDADEKRLRQVLINLLGNAVKFSPEGGRVTLSARRAEPASIHISVVDTGIGIDESLHESIFQPFVQADTSLSRTYEGTGLGLALVAQFVALHSGQVRVASRVGRGSEFTVELPVTQPGAAEPREAAVPAAVSADDELPEDGPTTEVHVLLAEDNASVASVVVAHLEDSGFSVNVAGDGLAAVAAAEAGEPDIILMDIQLPRLDGFAAIRRIREIPRLARTPIIALTGRAMPSESERCLHAGADLHVSKPCHMRELIAAMRGLLARPSS